HSRADALRRRRDEDRRRPVPGTTGTVTDPGRSRGAAMVRPASRELREPHPPTEIEAPIRIDAVEKTRGAAAYLDDLPEPKGCLHAAVIASTRAHADIRAV